MNWLIPTNANKTLEQTLSNATLAAENSAKIIQDIGVTASNVSTLALTLKTGTKAISMSYGI